MPPVDDSPERSAPGQSKFGPQCEACRSALESADRASVSFLLVETLTVPLIGCEDHLEQFTEVCDLTSDGTAKLLTHRPAGGIRCPGCRLASHNMGLPVIPIGGGATGVLACADHCSEIADRFREGLQTYQRLHADLDTFESA